MVDVAALRDALNSGHLAGAGIDVFPKEPKNNSEPFESALKGLPKYYPYPSYRRKYFGSSAKHCAICTGKNH